MSIYGTFVPLAYSQYQNVLLYISYKVKLCVNDLVVDMPNGEVSVVPSLSASPVVGMVQNSIQTLNRMPTPPPRESSDRSVSTWSLVSNFHCDSKIEAVSVLRIYDSATFAVRFDNSVTELFVLIFFQGHLVWYVRC